MRQAYDRQIARQTTNQFHGDREEFQPQIQALSYPEDVRQRVKLHAATSNLSYNMRPTRELYKLCVNGIHCDTTENGLRHIFSNYGNPIVIQLFRTRNNVHQPIAFVEFESKYEADNAIIGLDGKPPLNWEVMYAVRRPSVEVPFDAQDFLNLSTASHIGSRTGSFEAIDAARTLSCSRQSPCYIETKSSLDQHLPFLPCHVCGKRGSFVCVVCKTRYCSPGCQSRDWPSHQPICRPPPALLQEIPHGVISTNGVVSRPFRDCPSISSARPPNRRPSIDIRQDQISPSNCSSPYQSNGSLELTNPDTYLIKGIHPLDREKSKPPTAESPMTIHRNPYIGSERSSDSVRMMNVEDASKSPFINKEDDHPESLSFNWQTINPLPEPQFHSHSPSLERKENRHTASFRSNWDTPKNFSNNGFARKDNTGNVAQDSAVVSPSCKVSHQQAKGNKVYAKKFSCTQLELLLDKKSKVNVSWAKSPEEFYVQCYRYHDILEKIMEKVADSAPSSDPLLNPVEGMPCLALFHEDRNWYRAQVLKVLPDGVGIWYVDFGNTVIMPNTSEHLRMMEHALTKEPFHAIRVKLADVLPEIGNMWDADVKKKFKQLVENKPFVMEYVQMDADVAYVRLKNPDGSDPLLPLMLENLIKKATLDVSDELDQIPSAIDTPIQTPARQMVPHVVTPSNVGYQFPDENVVFENRNQLENSEKEINGSVLTTLVDETVPTSEALCIKTSEALGIKTSEALCIKTSEALRIKTSEALRIKTPDAVKLNVTEDGLVLNKLMRSPKKLPEEKITHGFLIVEAVSPDPACSSSNEKTSEDGSIAEFYYDDGPFLELPQKEKFQALIIKAENPQFIILRVENQEIAMKLTKLQEDIATYANDMPDCYSPKLNEICVARFPDGQWYRAVCLDVIPDQQPTGIRYSCNQIDYGELYLLDAVDIRPAKKWIIDFLPYLAQHAMLQGTDLIKQMEPKLVQRFTQILPENTVVEVSVVSCAGMSYVVHIPEVNATLSFEGLLQLSTQISTE